MGAIFGAPRDRVAVCEVAITSLKANEAANIETAEEIREAYKVGGGKSAPHRTLRCSQLQRQAA
jgi:hypothetical protein